MPEGGAIYFECRGRATGDGDRGWWAFWVKSVNEYFRLTESRLEEDIVEHYSPDPDGHHQSTHNHPAVRVIDGRVSAQRFASNYTRLASASVWDEDIDLWDNAYHTYGLMIDDTWVKRFFDGKELGRFATPIEYKQPLFILFNQDYNNNVGGTPVEGTSYVMGIDYIRVYEK
jgi:hypothetical protein